MITDKVLSPATRFIPAWFIAGIATVLLLIFGSVALEQPVALISNTEWFFLIQGTLFLATGIWVLSTTGIKSGGFFHDVDLDLKKDIKQAIIFFLIYGLIISAIVLLLSLLCYILIQTNILSPTEFLKTFNTPQALTAGRRYFHEILMNSPIKLMVYMFSVCVLIPAEEELFFRRFLYVYMRNKMSFTYALVFSSVIFGLVHLNGFITALAAGLFLGWIYEKKQRLAVNIIVHGLLNFSVMLIAAFYL